MLTLVAMLVLSGCAGRADIDKDDAFVLAVESRVAERHARSADAAWAFLDSADPDDPRYDRARMLLAQSAEDMGLGWIAGLIYRDVAKTRRNLDLVPDALAGIERILDAGAYDEDLLVTSFVAAEEFGFLPDEPQAFVEYHRGLLLASRGVDGWADEHLNALPESSSYFERAAYVRAVRHVADYQDDAALEILESLAGDGTLDPTLRLDVERTIARLAFEQERYDDALGHFQALRERAPNDPEILLETAWTQYYRGDSRTALGLLIALDAPVHATYIAPERYLLEALAYRRLCQFGAAREAAVRLRAKHGASLEALASGALPYDVAALRDAARLRGRAARHTRFVDRLAWERDHIGQLGLSDPLEAWVADQYARGTAEADRQHARVVGDEVLALAEELLAAEEGVRLIVHELGVSLLRGRRRPAGVAEKPAEAIPISGERAFFPFTGEYWTDEMDELVVFVEDRCID